jgi:hypothetical protein
MAKRKSTLRREYPKGISRKQSANRRLHAIEKETKVTPKRAKIPEGKEINTQIKNNITEFKRLLALRQKRETHTRRFGITDIQNELDEGYNIDAMVKPRDQW